MILKEWFRRRQQRRLKDPAYAFLFDPPPVDEYVVFDCETTGLDPRSAELLTIGAVRVVQNRIETKESLHLIIKPQKEVSEESIKVHHLRSCDVQNGIDPYEAVGRFVRFVGSRAVVGYYLEFDVAMVNKYLRPLIGIGLPNPKHEVSGVYYDYKIGRIPQGNVDLRFDTIMRDLGLPMLGQHNALSDATMTALIWLKLRKGVHHHGKQ